MPFIRVVFFVLFSALLGTEGARSQNLERLKDFKNIKDNKPFEWGGSLSVGYNYYRTSGAILRNAPYSYFLQGTPFARIYGVHIPITLTYSETGRSLTHPFHYNFNGMSPTYKWATVHAGFRSMRFSDYTLNGMIFNGVGFEIKPDKFRMSGFWGVFNPAVESDSNSADQAVILPAYRRTGYGLKVGYGGSKNYFDLVYFRGKDHIQSLKQPPTFDVITPSENVTIGPRFKITFLRRYYVESDLALSVFTRNTINDTLIETADIRKLYKVLRVNTTTYGSFAGHVLAGVSFDKWSLGFRTKVVSSDFQSMGINALQDDIKEFSANPSVRLLKGALTWTGSYGWYTDNLSRKRLTTTTRNIVNTNLALQMGRRVNLSLSYGNFGTTRSNGEVQMNDSITFSIINRTYGGNLLALFGSIKEPIAISLFSLMQEADDRNIFTRVYNKSKVRNSGISSNYTVKKIQLKISGGASLANFHNVAGSFSTHNFQAGLNKSLGKSKLKIGLSGSFVRRFEGESLQGNVISSRILVQGNPGKKHNFQVQYRWMTNSTGVVSNQLFNEQRVMLQYGIRI